MNINTRKESGNPNATGKTAVPVKDRSAALPNTEPTNQGQVALPVDYTRRHP